MTVQPSLFPMAFSQVLDKVLWVLPVIGEVLIANCFFLVSGEGNQVTARTTTVAAATIKVSSNGNSTSKQDGDGSDPYDAAKLLNQTNMNRMLVVLLTITVVTMCFFTCKYLTSKKAKKAKKYGVLATSGADVELRPLDDDEDDEEDVFNVNR